MRRPLYRSKVKRRFIVHVDMDAFFASVEMRDDPALRSKPVIVGSDPKGGKGRGVVSACSYEARTLGVHSAMPISKAYRICPNGVFLPVDMEKYSKASDQIYHILGTFTPDIEPVSIDEAFLDITGSHHLFGGPIETCRAIKKAIAQKTGLTASVGMAPSKIAAKIASDLRKPDGLVEVPEGEVAGFLRELNLGRLWGLGRKAEEELRLMGINTIGQFAALSPGIVKDKFGKSGIGSWELANGIDQTELSLDRDAKSVSNEFTFDKDTSDKEYVLSSIMELSDKVSRRLRLHDLTARTVTLKVRLAGFKTYTRSSTLEKETNITDLLYNVAKELYNEFGTKTLRLVGVKVSGFSKSLPEEDLFTQSIERKMRNIDSSVDKIRLKFGSESIYRASLRKNKG